MRHARVAALEAYKENPVKCRCCGAPIAVKDHEQPSDVRYERKFCGSSCAAKFNKNRKKDHPECLSCRSTLTAHRKTYCDNVCQQDHRFQIFVGGWLNGVSVGITPGGQVVKHVYRYFREKLGNKCQRCGWSQVNEHTGVVPLQLHHIDGDHSKNGPSDLEILCPNCHSLTGTWGSRNKGRGRLERY